MNKTLEKEEKKDIPELCLRCVDCVKDADEYYCEFKYIEVLQPNIACFRPKDVSNYIRFSEIMKTIDTLENKLYEINAIYFKDIRNVPKIYRKITKIAKLIKLYYNQSMRDFKRYLDKNNLKFDKNYFIPT
ncbi:MAG: hypothetical protein ACFFCV_18730 [Promethearchaeota archaeon]